jgi:deoxyribodipyrimidine photo-lyase
MMILYHFPHTMDHAFRPEYDRIKWVNDENNLKPGAMAKPVTPCRCRHARIECDGLYAQPCAYDRASFLTKDLLIDWRWGEHYFAKKLLDYEMASNVGGWQWAAGSGTDAAPYFSIFSPDAQTKKFDPKFAIHKKMGSGICRLWQISETHYRSRFCGWITCPNILSLAWSHLPG